MAPREAAAPRQLYDPKSDSLVDHRQRKMSDASDSSGPKQTTSNRKLLKSSQRPQRPDPPSPASTFWKREPVPQVTQLQKQQDIQKKEDLRKKIREERQEEGAALALERKAARAKERAARPPRTLGKLYRYNADGELIDVDGIDDPVKAAKFEKKRTRLDDGKTIDDKNSKLRDKKDRKPKGKKGRDDEKPDTDSPENDKGKGEKSHPKVRKGEKEEVIEQPPVKRVIPPPPPEAWAVGKNPLVPTAPPPPAPEPVPEPERTDDKDRPDDKGAKHEHKSRRGAKGSKAIGPSNIGPNNNKAKSHIGPSKPQPNNIGPNSGKSKGSQADPQTMGVPFSSFNHFSGGDLWQGDSMPTPLALPFQNQSPFGGGMPGSVNSSGTWGAVGGLAPLAKGLYGFNLSYNGDSPHSEHEGEWNPTDHGVENGNPIWENDEVLVGLGNFDIDHSMIPLSDSELNPSAPAVDSFGRIVDAPPSEPQTSKRHQRGPRNKGGGKNLKGTLKENKDGEKVPENKPSNHRSRGKGKHQAPKGLPVTPGSEPVPVESTIAPAHHKGRGRGKGKGQKGNDKSTDLKKPIDEGSDKPKTGEGSSRRRGKGSKK
eukprot:CAMPEP_0114375194 /NCGR_PEP_ID=MMETSP0101-20121206/36124_1 /TAXON_ID=38822 ORGANISM="Pteridomonas danica, Strain PT" /NCGR_SAMPLE_ID=MMETSP0101 /ASSEMBLY_ACC=CAM_ASM_000211 /LENGTH=595 /DNA_ID=CAMNT_0001529195 /DNA_START=24 /DNA_END=1811 /DNA_ORIENTATION=+